MMAGQYNYQKHPQGSKIISGWVGFFNKNKGMKNLANMGHSTYAGTMCDSNVEVNFVVAGVTASRYHKEDEAFEKYRRLHNKLRKVESKPTNVGICRLQEAELRALWAWEDAKEDHEILIESFQALIEDGHIVGDDVYQDTSVEDIANGLVEGIINSIIKGVSKMSLPWRLDGKTQGFTAEKALQKAIGNAYGNIKSHKTLDKDVKGLVLSGLQAYRGGKARRTMNQSYKNWCDSHKISWQTGEWK